MAEGICTLFNLQLCYSHFTDHKTDWEKFSGLLETMKLRAQRIWFLSPLTLALGWVFLSSSHNFLFFKLLLFFSAGAQNSEPLGLTGHILFPTHFCCSSTSYLRLWPQLHLNLRHFRVGGDIGSHLIQRALYSKLVKWPFPSDNEEWELGSLFPVF